MPRTRTTKKLAQRIDLNYFKRQHPLRRWRLILSVALPLIALAWLSWHGIRRDQRVFSAGGLSAAHAVLSNQCAACHVTQIWYTRGKPSDQKCQACHDGSIHHGTQTFTPSCMSCHVEHRGPVRLAETTDASCTQCHANLMTRGTTVNYVRSIHSFTGDHPEFAALRKNTPDTGTIQMNHYRHMLPNLAGPNGRVQMTCNDCHRAAMDTNRPWRFAATQIGSEDSANAAAAKPADPLAAATSRAYMGLPVYSKTCAACHALQFDHRLPDAAPHDTPEVVHRFVLSKLQSYIATHPADLRVPRDPTRDLPARAVPPDYRVLSPAQWVSERVAEDERLLWRKTCKQCHTIVLAQDNALPKIASANISTRFMPHAKFDHTKHELVTCTSCHTSATTSQQSSDLLLPGIATCRACHHAGTEAAESRCFECHTYHDPTRHQPPHSTFSLRDLVSRVGLATDTQ